MKRRDFIFAAPTLAGGLWHNGVRAVQPCPPPTVSVAGGGSASTACVAPSSALAVLAAAMVPGTWAKLNPANDQNPILGVGPISGTMLHYCNSMPWNPVSKVIELVGMDHNAGALRHVRYDTATNTYAVVAADVGLGTGTQHGYDHNSVNPYTGDLYYRQYSVNSGKIRVYKKALGSSSFVAIPPGTASAGAEQAAIGTCWWSGSFSGAGNQGCLVVFNSGNAVGSATDGQITAYDPLTNAWFYSQDSKAPFYGSGATYHSVIEYSAKKNVAVYGGGDVARNKLWRLNADGSFTAMPNVPTGKGVGMQAGLLVDDPVTGNFLLLSAGELWELNPSGTGTWTQQTGSRTPPSAVGIPGPGNPVAVICSPIADHGVVAFITQPSQTGGSTYLYKHA